MSIRKLPWLAALFALLAVGATPAHAKVRVIAATENLAWVTDQIGGTLISTDYIARGNQDPHMIEPRPSQVVKLARADMLVRIGMDLDLWLELAPGCDAQHHGGAGRGGSQQCGHVPGQLHRIFHPPAGGGAGLAGEAGTVPEGGRW